jgi:hypothetical protein
MPALGEIFFLERLMKLTAFDAALLAAVILVIGSATLLNEIQNTTHGAAAKPEYTVHKECRRGVLYSVAVNAVNIHDTAAARVQDKNGNHILCTPQPSVEK